MPERASVFEGVQLGVESLAAPGTPVAAIKKLEAIAFDAKPKFTTKRFRPIGYKPDSLVIPGTEMTDFRLTGIVGYTNIIYALASVMNSATPVTVGTNGRDWTFLSFTSYPDTQQTYTYEGGSALRAQQVSNVKITELGLSFKREEASLTGAAIGQLFNDNINITGNAVYTLSIIGATAGTFTLTYSAQTTAVINWNATAADVEAALKALNNIGDSDVIVTGGPLPSVNCVIRFTGALGGQTITLTGTFTGLTGGTNSVTSTKAGVALTTITEKPLIPGSVNIYADATIGTIGTTKLTRVNSADFRIAGRNTPEWVLNSSNPSYVADVESPYDITMKLSMAADGVGMGYLTTIRAADPVFLRIQSVGPALPAPDGAFNYTFTLDMAANLEMLDDFGAKDNVQRIDWTFRGIHNTTLGGASKAVVRNLQTAL